MAITTSVWEDSGALIGVGTPPIMVPTVRQEVDNLGFKDSPLDETFTFADYPIGRDADGSPFTDRYSYKKYYYFAFGGTYTTVDSLFISMEGDPNGEAQNVSIVYDTTNVYTEPDNSPLVGTTYPPDLMVPIVPNLSTIGPEFATTSFTPVANTTYYTNYIVVQLVVHPSSDPDDYGNLNNSFKLKFSLNELKTGLPGFDETIINWSP